MSTVPDPGAGADPAKATPTGDGGNLPSAAGRHGLTTDEARARLQRDGYNELPRLDRRTFWRIAGDVLREPMLALLLVGGIIYLLLGDLQEALILLVFATFSVLVTVIQETRTERVLDALRDLTSPRALVIRDGTRQRIAGREVVRGDLIVLNEGDRVPADAMLLQATGLQTDESLLTGESVPVRKRADDTAGRNSHPRPGGDDLPLVFSGSLVVRGSGLGAVSATGLDSEIGKIGRSLASLETEPPRLQRQVRRLVQNFAWVGGAACLLAVLLFGLLRGGWLDAMLAGITLGMSMLPEELPVVLTVFMAMGAWRISRARVLTRRAAAIEALGAATVLCTDKTGTLTENRMAIAALWPAGFIDTYVDPASTGDTLPAGSHDLLTYGILASAPEAIDPMERAFHDLGQRHPDVIAPLRDGRWRIRHAYGLQPDLLAMSQVWQRGDDTAALVVATKGAPETIAALCRLSPDETAAVLQSVNQMAAAGMRVLGVGRADFSGDVLPATQRDFAFTFLGLVGLSDPLRPSARAAVADCHAAGIRVIMITGDYPATAAAIATQAGLTTIDVVTGDDLASLGVDALAHRLRQATIFARVMPEQKLRIVEALKANGEVVAMTGDGVNDAPSLKAAHIGIAMGGRGTDVAREASAIVLLDDDLGSVVKAISLGRRIYDNLRKAMGFIFAVHVPIAGLALLPLAFGLPIIFSPIHIAFLEMVIDPVCSLVFEAETEEADVMRRPPRPTGTPVFTGRLIAWSLLQGFITFLVLAGFYLVALHRGMPEAETRALTFFTLVLTIVGLIFVNRTFSVSPGTALRRPNKMLGGVLLMVTAMLSVTLGWPVARTLFRFGPLHGDDIGLAIAATLGLFILLEGLKRLWRAHLAF